MIPTKFRWQKRNFTFLVQVLNPRFLEKETLPGYGKKTLPPSSPLFSVEDEAVSFKYSEKRLLVGTPALSEWSGTRFVQGFVHGNQWYGIPWLTV